MTEISALRCNDCGTKAFLDDPESPNWMTDIMTVPASRIRLEVHYCPSCTSARLDSVKYVRQELTSDQQRVVNPGYVDPAMEALLNAPDDKFHEREDAKSGVPITSTPSGGVPAVTWPNPTTAPSAGPGLPRRRGGKPPKTRINTAARQAATQVVVVTFALAATLFRFKGLA